MTRSTLLVTLGVMLSLFMASMESTVVATAMPTIVGQLGGLSSYSWVFSSYLVASTTMVPIFGKLSDQYGRRPLHAAAMVLFLGGSLLCGSAASMNQLIAFRVLQGVGAGGVMPLAFTIVGALFGYEQRARMQGLFSSVWGLSSIVGPLIGGFLVDQISWRWIFYINVVPGLLAGVLIWVFMVDDPRHDAGRPVRVDYAGAALLALAVVAVLLGLFVMRTGSGLWLLAVGAALVVALWRVERHAADPMLPLALFRERLFAVANTHGLLSGFAMFGSIAFVPLFVQVVLGTSATRAGVTLTPFMLGWVSASVTGTRLLLRVGYRSLAVAGMMFLTFGALLMSRVGAGASQLVLAFSLAMMGIGMGLSVPSFTIAVQTAVARKDLGTATSSLQFSRSIGGAIGVSVMGAALSARLAHALRDSGLDPGLVSLSRLLDPLARAQAATALDTAVRNGLADAIQGIFAISVLVAAIGLAATAMAPRGSIAQLDARRRASQERPG